MEQGVTLLKEYTVALEYEEKLLFQKAKVYWLNDGDRNFAFFHKVLKFLGVQKGKECLAVDNNMFLNKTNSQDALKMVEEITNDEIKAAMLDIEDNKAHGPDSFTTEFFKKA
nr:hypothetical protein [Tanacetum cinerariifolium]